jgi:hypothetical protein
MFISNLIILYYLPVIILFLEKKRSIPNPKSNKKQKVNVKNSQDDIEFQKKIKELEIEERKEELERKKLDNRLKKLEIELKERELRNSGDIV